MYVRQLIEKDVGDVNGGPEAGPSVPADAAPQAGRAFAEILAPIHQDFRDSGMTETELDALIEECRDEVWREQQARKSP